MAQETVIRYIAGFLLVAVTAVVLGVLKRDTPRAVFRETIRLALYIYGGAIALGALAYVICLFK